MAKMWSILENVPCALEKKVYSSAIGWKVLKISIRSFWSNVSLKVCISLLILCFDDLSLGEGGMLKSPTIVLLLLISPLCLLVFVLCIEVFLCWVHRHLQLLYLSLGVYPLIIMQCISLSLQFSQFSLSVMSNSL